MTDKLNEKSLISALESRYNNSKVILEQYDFGVYAIYFEDEANGISTRDDLYDTLDDAKEFCKEDYSILENSWEEISAHNPIMVKG